MRQTAAIYFDVTMLVESRGPAHGILRVLRETADLLARDTSNLVPCVYDNRRRCFRRLLNWTDVMAARDRHASAPKPPFVGHPSVTVPQSGSERSPLLRGLLYSLPLDMRGHLISAFGGAVTAATGLAQASRHVSIKRPAVRAQIGDRIAYGKGDVLLQPGAQWFGVGIAIELSRAAAAGTRIVSVVYDAIPILRPEFVGPSSTRAFAGWFRAMLATSRSILAISQTVKADTEQLARDWNSPCPPVSVLRLGDDSLPPPPSTVSPEIAALADTPFVVCVGTIEIRKNHRLLALIWRRLAGRPDTPRLVIVGRKGWLVEETMCLLERDSTIKPHITVVQGASDAELSWLISKSMFSVFPSMVEGWGLPVGEALAAGCIVIASDDPAVVEAGQGLALHLPPDDVPAWTDVIRALAADPERRLRMEADIRARFQVYPWSRTALDLANHVQRIASTDANDAAASPGDRVAVPVRG